MAKRRVRFTFPPELIPKPTIWQLGRDFEVITNIRRANVTRNQGWVVLEVEGNLDDVERGLRWVSAQGIRVDPVGGDLVEG